ncbi:MAG TPA: hypothetical protein VJ750_10085 [Rhizomicrobium sp.]|nr:hypothetical protein [Rhizomicrobium sp.]
MVLILGSGSETMGQVPAQSEMLIRQLSASELASNAASLKDLSSVNVEVFYKPNFDTAMRPPRAVEEGARCLISNPKDVAELAKIFSALTIKGKWEGQVAAAIEIRFLRAGRTVFSAMFTDGGARDAKGELLVPGAVNDRVAVFSYEPVSRLFKFAENRMSGPSAGGACAEFRT